MGGDDSPLGRVVETEVLPMPGLKLWSSGLQIINMPHSHGDAPSSNQRVVCGGVAFASELMLSASLACLTERTQVWP
jgi:hypothetical protein